jgi:hypothetical protein
VLNSRRRATTPIDRAQVEYLLGQLAANKVSNDIVETGIKVIHLMCPIRAGGTVAIATEYGAGMTVVLEEIVRRISKGPHPVTMLALFPPPSEIWPPSLDENYSIAESLAMDGTATAMSAAFRHSSSAVNLSRGRMRSWQNSQASTRSFT